MRICAHGGGIALLSARYRESTCAAHISVHSAPLCADARAKLLDQVRQTARLKHFSLRTERAYTQWVYRFVVHHGKRHPREMDAREVQAFLMWLAVERKIAQGFNTESRHVDRPRGIVAAGPVRCAYPPPSAANHTGSANTVLVQSTAFSFPDSVSVVGGGGLADGGFRGRP